MSYDIQLYMISFTLSITKIQFHRFIMRFLQQKNVGLFIERLD